MIKATLFQDGLSEEWDTFVSRAPMATFQHRRRFLSYHGLRFQDFSLILVDETDHWIGVLPAAAHPNDTSVVVSHPGATFGGLIHQGGLTGERMIAAMQMIRDTFQGLGFRKLIYKPVPTIYHSAPAQEDRYALFRQSAQLLGCGLSATIELGERRPSSNRRRRSLRKAEQATIVLAEGVAEASAMWPIFSEVLQRRHGATPVHSLSEICLLHDRFPEEISFIGASLDGEALGGIVLFHTRTVTHVQYSIISELGMQNGAMDAAIEYAIGKAIEHSSRFFDFGISTNHDGTELNSGLHQFKMEFGAGTVTYDRYMIPLGTQ